MDRTSKINLLRNIMDGDTKQIKLLKDPYKPSLEEMKRYVSICKLKKEEQVVSEADSSFLTEFTNKTSGGIKLDHFTDVEFLIDIMGGVYKKLCASPFVTCHTKDCPCHPVIDLPHWLD